jgi:hypothetical protein
MDNKKIIADEEFFEWFEFCCGWLKHRVTLDSTLRHDAFIIYSPDIRAYGFKSIDGEDDSCAITYCPFCGTKFPESLGTEWFYTIYDELGPEYLPDDDGNPPKKELPHEFHTDEWWKKRGL